jgi:hypothetical protein
MIVLADFNANIGNEDTFQADSNEKKSSYEISIISRTVPLHLVTAKEYMTVESK